RPAPVSVSTPVGAGRLPLADSTRAGRRDLRVLFRAATRLRARDRAGQAAFLPSARAGAFYAILRRVGYERFAEKGTTVPRLQPPAVEREWNERQREKNFFAKLSF